MVEERTQDGRRYRSPLLIAGVAMAVLFAGGGGAYWATTSGSGNSSNASPGGTPSATTLPTGPGSAPVQRPGTVSRAAVEKLAKALGVPGTVTSDAGFWKAGGGAGPTLQVLKAAPGSWSYARYGTGVHSTSGAAVAEQKALDKAAPLLAALGLGGAKTDASQTANGLRTVSADPVVAGLPTHGWSTSLKIDPDGVLTSANGPLSPLTKGDVQPVMSAEKALKNLNAARGGGEDHGIGECPTVVPKESKAPGDDPKLPTVLPCVPTRTQPLNVRKAVFGLSSQYVAGRQALVPSWLFEVTQAGVKGTTTLAQPAVDTTEATPPGLVDITSYTVDGNSLKLSFWGGVCSTYTASADQSGQTVKAQVTEVRKHPERPCIMIAKLFTKTVPLGKPLGARKVVDAFDGKAVPKK
ncbi:hypothetical protein ACFXJ5_17255 [Streptomyces sp. NPDC059373]